VNKFNAIFNHSKLNKIRTLLVQFKELFENLSELCNTSPQNTPVGVKFPLQKIAKNLPRLLTNGYFDNIMVPAQKFRTLVLPRINTNRNTKHNPFPEYDINTYTLHFIISNYFNFNIDIYRDLVYIHGIKDEVYIYSSLQKPKRIIILGSDGNEYPMMCKPKVNNCRVNIYLRCSY